MQVKICDRSYFCSNFNKDFENFFKVNRNKWVDVDTECLFDNQYNVQGFRIFDTQILEIKDDIRVNTGYVFDLWQGVKPELKTFDHLVNESTFNNDLVEFKKYFPDGFTLTVYKSLGYYRFTNHCRTNINFLYKNGVFYIDNKVGYKPIKNFKDFKGLVRQDAIKPLQEFFRNNY